MKSFLPSQRRRRRPLVAHPDDFNAFGRRLHSSRSRWKIFATSLTKLTSSRSPISSHSAKRQVVEFILLVNAFKQTDATDLQCINQMTAGREWVAKQLVFLLPRTRELLPQCGARSRRFAGCMRFLAHQGRLMKTAHCPWQRQPIQAAGQDQKDRRQSEKHQRKIAASLIVIGSLVADVHETLTKKASNSTSCYVNDRPDLLGNREEIVKRFLQPGSILPSHRRPGRRLYARLLIGGHGRV